MIPLNIFEYYEIWLRFEGYFKMLFKIIIKILSFWSLREENRGGESIVYFFELFVWDKIKPCDK